MKSVNKACLLGNLGHSPDTKYTESGLAICKTTLATNRYTKTGDEVTWHNLVFFGKAAEVIQKYVTKGEMLYVEGYINNTSYTGRDDVKKTRSEVVVNDFVMLGRRQTASEATEEPIAARKESMDLVDKLKAEGIEAAPQDFDDDIPF